MRTLRRGGVTLIELLLVLVMLGLVGLAGWALVRSSVRHAVRATTVLTSARDAAAFVALLGHDLRAASAGDITLPSTDVLEFDRPIGEALDCAGDSVAVVLRASSWRGTRLPAASRDEVWLLTDPDTAAWTRRPIVAVTSGWCRDGTAAIQLGLGLPGGRVHAVRVVEPVRLRVYTSGGRAWLGLEHRSNGTVIQPIAGPLAAGAVGFSSGPGFLAASLVGAGGVVVATRLPLE